MASQVARKSLAPVVDRLDPALLRRDHNPIARPSSNALERGRPATTPQPAPKRSPAQSWRLRSSGDCSESSMACADVGQAISQAPC